MGRKNLSDTKVSNIKKLRELGYTVKKTAELTGVSMMTVNDYTLPGFYEKRLKASRDYIRRTMLGTGTTKGNAVVLKHLNKRPYTGRCEVCGKLREKGLHYHHWNKDNPSVGLWLCFKCHRLAELMDEKGPKETLELMGNYDRLKKEVEVAGNGNISSKSVSES